MDFTSDKIEQNIAATKNFGRLFTFSLVAIIFTTIGYLHYRYIKKALNKFTETFRHIEQGDLTKRVEIPPKDELGQLASHLNHTLDKLQEYQQKIEAYHRRELENAQRLATVGEMAASFAHEIKNPLTGIVNALNLLVQDMNDPEKEAILKEIQAQSLRVTEAINDLLQFSKPVKIHPQPGDLNQLINSLVQDLKNHTNNKMIRCQKFLDPKIPVFPFDANQLERVLMNIGINAIQAIPEKGTITFRTRFLPDKGKVEISIKDNGVGIPPENLSKIFRPFFTTKHQGTGLGLAICHNIITKHGGTIQVKSQVNKGSEFIIQLPLQPENTV